MKRNYCLTLALCTAWGFSIYFSTAEAVDRNEISEFTSVQQAKKITGTVVDSKESQLLVQVCWLKEPAMVLLRMLTGISR